MLNKKQYICSMVCLHIYHEPGTAGAALINHIPEQQQQIGTCIFL